MIINSLCNTCYQAYEILVEVSDVELIKQIRVDDTGHTAKCPRLCGGFINLVGDAVIDQMSQDPRLKDPIRISGKELYQAVNGLGLPDEVPMNKDTIEMLLKTQMESFAVDATNGKFYISELRFEGGRTLHLTSGPYGAQVLKITKERA